MNIGQIYSGCLTGILWKKKAVIKQLAIHPFQEGILLAKVS